MSRLLAAPKTATSLGGLYVKTPQSEEASRLTEEFQSVNYLVWDRKAAFAENRDARRKWRAVGILCSTAFAGTTHFVFKRSFPFGTPRERYVPYLQDVDEMVGNVQFVVMHRDPRASSYSTLRRGFDKDLRGLAVLCSEQLTLLAAQSQTVPENRLKVVSYSKLCLAPADTVAPLLRRCDLDHEAVQRAIEREFPKPKVDDLYRRALLGADQVARLEEFLDERRRRHRAFLKAAVGE
jgi:Sulfotransferase family